MFKHICPHCNQAVSIPDGVEGTVAPCPQCSQHAKWAGGDSSAQSEPRAQSRWSDEAKGYAVIVVAAIVLGVWYWNSGGVMCYPVAHNGWTFECKPGEATGPKFDEQFPPSLIAVAERQGQDLTRTFRGTRWFVQVKVESGKGSVLTGGVYKMYGTVESIYGNRVNFRDCTFVK